MSNVIAISPKLVEPLASLPRGMWFPFECLQLKNYARVVSCRSSMGPIVVEYCESIKNSLLSGPRRVCFYPDLFKSIELCLKEAIPITLVNVPGLSRLSRLERSLLIALLAYTPEYYICYPLRRLGDSQKNQQYSRAHLIWLPSKPHALGWLGSFGAHASVSEISSASHIYDAIDPASLNSKEDICHLEKRLTCLQIKIVMIQIGELLGFRTYIAKNDQGVIYDGKRISELPAVVSDLASEKLVSAYDEAIKAGRLIDCVWFKNGRIMPAVMEVEHSAGITSGLTRMKNFQSYLPPFPTRWTIVAPDEDRNKVIEKCNNPQFKELNAKYLPYSAVEELYSLCQRRKITGVDDTFLDCFMENTVN